MSTLQPDNLAMGETAVSPAIPADRGAMQDYGLYNGDVMSREEFHALYEKTPPGFKAELIDGVVLVASPVGQWRGKNT